MARKSKKPATDPDDLTLRTLTIRALWGVWSAILLAVVLAVSAAIGAWLLHRPVPVIDHAWRHGSLLARITLIAGLIVGSLGIVALLVWFTVKLYVASRPAGPDTSKLTAIVERTAAVTRDTVKEVGAQLSEQIGALDQKLSTTIPTPTPVANLRAPDGLPRAYPFVGRREQLEQLKAQLRRGTTTGVTALKGMGGIGKTALAAEAVAELSGETVEVDGQQQRTFPGGAIWIACNNLRGSGGLDSLWLKLAGALDVSLAGVTSAADAINTALQNRPRTLVALDNIEAEHRETVDGREVILPPLDVRAALNALAVPDHTVLLLTARQTLAPERVTPMRVDQLEPSDAIDLFIARLAQASEGARPTSEDRALIPSLTHNLGELPLAIELTAAYAGEDISLATIAKELERDGVNAAAFQSDPELAITSRFERSIETLTDPQLLLFAGLSLNVGPSFPRQAAVALAATIHSPDADKVAPGPEADTDVSALVRFALAESLSGERLRLHPLLRDYAGTRLRSLPPETQRTLGARLAAYWLAYAEAHPGYEGMDALESEAENLMGAVEWANADGEHPLVQSFTYALYRAWDTRGRRRDQRRMYEAAMTAATAGDDKDAQRWVLHHMALLDYYTGNIAAARAGNARALQLAEEMGAKSAIRAETHALAVLDAQTGNIQAARDGYARALALAEELGDKSAIQAETHALAVLDYQTGNVQAARDGYERALRLAEELGDKSAIRDETHGLAVFAFNQGDLLAAREGHERSLALGRELGDPSAVASDLRDLGDLLALTGEPKQGRQMLAEAIRIYTELGDVLNLAVCHEYSARLDVGEGNRDGAIQQYRQALALYEQVQAADRIAEVRAALRRLGAE